MTLKPKFKSDAVEAIHSSARALHKFGAISKATLREFDESCLVMPVAMKPKQTKTIRECNHVSQPIFARYLNTSESTVQKWESVAKVLAGGRVLKLLMSCKKYSLKVLA